MTLWPEVRKLYGHNNATFAMAASGDGGLLASGCRAQTAAVAVLRLWDTSTWAEVQALQGHTLTVTAVTFMCDDNRIVSVSRDRSLCVFARHGPAAVFSLVSRVEKSHDRVPNAIVAHPSPPPPSHPSSSPAAETKKSNFGMWVGADGSRSKCSCCRWRPRCNRHCAPCASIRIIA